MINSKNPMPITLEKIVSTENFSKAIERVQRNECEYPCMWQQKRNQKKLHRSDQRTPGKFRIGSHNKKTEREKEGNAGIDGMRTDQIKAYYKEHQEEILNAVLDGKYTPKPLLRVHILTKYGRQKSLGIPTVLDRVIQEVVAQVLSEEWEKEFSDNSFCFRPGRESKDAVQRIKDYLNQGKKWIVYFKISNFFDTLNHSKLLQILSDRIKDGRVISLIHKFIRTPDYLNGKVGHKNTIGISLGGYITPILANIYLNELDQILDKSGVCFSRYADDMIIVSNSKYAAQRALAKATKFIEKKLFLKVDEERTKIEQVVPGMKFLGRKFSSVSDNTNNSNYRGKKQVLNIVTDDNQQNQVFNSKNSIQ